MNNMTGAVPAKGGRTGRQTRSGPFGLLTVLVLTGLLTAIAAVVWAGPEDDYWAARDAQRNRLPDEAIRLYTKAIDSGQLTKEQLGKAYSGRGTAWMDTGNPDQAIADYSLAIQVNPKDGAAYHNRGLAWKEKKNPEKAIADFTTAVTINPRDADSYFDRGNIRFDNNELDKAIADFTKAVEADPNFAYAYYNRAVAYANQGKLGDALGDAKKALSVQPTNRGFQSLVNELDMKVKSLQ